jgi:hypothetical protein
MRSKKHTKEPLNSIGDWIAVYGLWLAGCAVAFLLMIALRQMILTWLDVAGADELTRTAVDRFGFFGLSIFCLFIIVYLEHYYRTGHGQGLLYIRFTRSLGIELFLLGAMHFTSMALVHVSSASWAEILVPLAEGIAGLSLTVVSFRLPETKGE